MEKHGPEFYDEAKVFETYITHRSNSESPNETIEQPILWDLIADPKGLKILDLGCGDARIAKRFREAGAKSYLGIEGSRRMFNLAKQNTEIGYSDVTLSWVEDYIPPENAFDLVVSSLAFHYIADLSSLLRKANRSLRSGGRLIFSVEHPVITSCNQALETSAIRQAWIVDNYFERGERTVQWMGDNVTKYHRTIEDFLNALKSADFTLQQLRESDPPRELFKDESLWSRRRRIPLFLFLAASKN
jgi:SAM-dependent methyltransferase